ncbi:hypothetical protein [Pseudomonas putida]|uniref:hypothetical protein n=1 Tax=Pseudomonas putida TaxID=303 RepID=UPI0009BD586C|nr:hypothetical protein [Pseudomonas putida]
MIIRSLAKNLPPDPDNEGSVLGWGLVDKTNWDFVDVYPSREVAEAEAAARGGNYTVDYGSHELGTDNYVGGLTPPV